MNKKHMQIYRSHLSTFFLLGLLAIDPAIADICPSLSTKLELRSSTGAWSDGGFTLIAKQEWALIDLDDLAFPIPLPKIKDTTISGALSPTVALAPSQPPSGQTIGSSFYILPKDAGSCALLLVVSPDQKQAISLRFNPADGTPISASQLALGGVAAGSTLGIENIDKSGSSEFVARSSNGLLNAVFTTGADSTVNYDPLLTVEAIWTDFVERASRSDQQALQYLAPEVKAEYSAPAAFAALGRIKAVQKDSDFIKVEASFAQLAVILNNGGTDYIHYVVFKKTASGWLINNL